MITDNEKFIEIQTILAFSNINIGDCTKTNDLIIKLSKENKILKEVIDKAIEYNKELSEMYDVGSMERSNADTNLLILGDIKTIDILSEVSEWKTS